MYGVTKDGFRRKSYREIIEDMENLAKELFGEDIDLSERNPMAKSLQNIGWEISTLWEMGEDVYNSAFVDTSEDSSLDGVGKYITVSRKGSQHSKGWITIEGIEDTRVPKGFRVSTEKSGIIYETVESSTIGEDGLTNIQIISIETGLDNNLAAMTLTKIVNPISGVKKVYNTSATSDGIDTEEDKEFRERYYRSTSLGGSATRQSVEAALLNVPDITDAFVEENESMEYLEDIPPKALAPYIFGGTDEVIGNTILTSKAGGIRSYGSTEVEVMDTKGIIQVIGFTRPTIKDIYVKLNLSKGLGYPGDDIIRKAVLNYIGGTDLDALVYKGLKLGEDVIISKLMASVMCLEGINDIDVEISADSTEYINSNIQVEKKEIARTSFDKVVINYV